MTERDLKQRQNGRGNGGTAAKQRQNGGTPETPPTRHRNGRASPRSSAVCPPMHELVGGPANRPWREVALTRAAELDALRGWLQEQTQHDVDRTDEVRVLASAVARHLEAAREAAGGRRYFSRDGSRLERAMSNLDAAEADLLNLAPEEYVLGQMPGLLNHVQRHLGPTDPRRTELERIAQRVGVKDPEHPLAHPEKSTLGTKKREIARSRGTIVSTVRGASSAALREQRQVRSFRTVVTAVSGLMLLAAVGLGVLGWVDPTAIPLCFEPADGDEVTVVCPTGESSPLPTTPGSAGDVDDAIDDTVGPIDMLVVEVVGATAAMVAAAVSIRRIRGSSEPYGVPVALAALKVPTGALTAVLGLLLMRGEFIPGLSALDSSAQIVSWAIVFGYAQQLFTRFVDEQADTVLDHVRSGNAIAVDEPATER